MTVATSTTTGSAASGYRTALLWAAAIAGAAALVSLLVRPDKRDAGPSSPVTERRPASVLQGQGA